MYETRLMLSYYNHIWHLRKSNNQSALIHPESLARTLHIIKVYGKLSNYLSGGTVKSQIDQKEKELEKKGRKWKEMGKYYKTKRQNKVVEGMW